MSKSTGILLDENFDLKVNVQRDESGLIISDLEIGDTTYQNQKLLLLCNKGEVKEFPTSGVGVQNYLEDNSAEELAREIRKEFSDDDMVISKIIINIPSLEIEAEYK